MTTHLNRSSRPPRWADVAERFDLLYGIARNLSPMSAEKIRAAMRAAIRAAKVRKLWVSKKG